MGPPNGFALRYYEEGIDEIIFMDTVASLYGRNNLAEIVRATAKDVFIPMTVGGGIRSVEDAALLLRSGADKIALNTAAVREPSLITRISERFGAQCVVLSVEAKRVAESRWEAYTENGRERTGLDVMEWVTKAVKLGVGEILLTSVDQEGTRKGFDVELTRRVSERVSVPVIASGGLGNLHHLLEIVNSGHADAVAVADALHYRRLTIGEIKQYASENRLDMSQRNSIGLS
jgi:cyclase